jgi:hypothetical protein
MDEVYLRNGDRISGQIVEEGKAGITIDAEAIGLISVDKSLVDRIMAHHDKEAQARTKQQQYLDEYFGKIDMRVYWGTAKEFMSELQERAASEGITGGT